MPMRRSPASRRCGRCGLRPARATPRWRRCSGSDSRASTTRAPASWASKRSTTVADRPLEHVVGEHHDAAVAVDEPLGQPERVRDAAGLLLVAVEELVDAVLVAVTEQPEELARVRAARDEHQLGTPGADERLDRVGHHRPVVDRQQVLVRDPRQRMEARAAAAGEDYALHSRANVPSRSPHESGAASGVRQRQRSWYSV